MSARGPCTDAVAEVRRWRAAGMRLAGVAAAGDAQALLAAAGLEGLFDATVEEPLAGPVGAVGTALEDEAVLARGAPTAPARTHAGPASLHLEAVRRLGIEPGDALVVEGTVAGVQAAAAAGFGLVVGVAAIAWSVAAYEYALNLREQTALSDRELVARIDASKEGRSLQPSTLPPPEDPKKKAAAIGFLLVGGLVLAAGVVAAPVLFKKLG